MFYWVMFSTGDRCVVNRSYRKRVSFVFIFWIILNSINSARCLEHNVLGTH
ncbi:hypothetical protein [Rubritalea tangerina]|uniref:hypothetical protein n=1 Tax=Rubritalea tangerina TaxID=430798 RepID=UPI00360F2542